MNNTDRKLSARTAASIGLLALASAMGIGRFSLTPILPLMQQDAGLSLNVAGWLATANYVGYLLGAILCIVTTPLPNVAIRWGLIGVGLTTLAMGLVGWSPLWLALRFISGGASAFVLVGTSAWVMPILRHHGKENWSGHVFAGVGIGIAFAGAFGLAAAVDAWGSRLSWIGLGLIATALALILWRPLNEPGAQSLQGDRPPGTCALSRPAVTAAICYGIFGFGYIIPATFLPALAKSYVDDPVMFGLVWPIFGGAAALSTFASRWLGRGLMPWQLWTRAKWVLVGGVLAPALWINRPTLLVSAVCVGGSFMIITMAGIKEALRLGDAPAPLAVGIMTAAFGAGQIVGPLLVNLLTPSGNGFALASIIAVLFLIAANCVLLYFSGRPEVRSPADAGR